MTAIRWCLFAALAGTSPAAPPAKDYELLFEDDFKGNKLDESTWMYREGPRKSGTWINGLNRKENVFVRGGNLVVRCKVEEINGKTENTGGGVISKSTFGYGYYETRSKPFMEGKGVHSAFWQAGQYIDGKWNHNNRIFEIDSFEIDSGHWVGANNLYVHICPEGMGELPWPYRNGLVFKLDSGGWWIDAYEYTPEGVTFYEHGKRVGHADFKDLAAQQVVWLTALNGCGKVDASKQPGDTLFDYFRFYAKDFPGHNLLPNGDFEYNSNKTPERPVAWHQEGTPGTCRIIPGDAANDAHHLRVGNGEEYDVRLHQSIPYIRNGIYQITAKVRNPGGKVRASLTANGRPVNIPACDGWTEIRMDRIEVREHRAEIVLSAVGDVGTALDVDDIRFMKPVAAGAAEPPRRPFTLVRDPIWQIAMDEPIRFTGDSSFFFISRNVGYGDAMTLKVNLTPGIVADMCPITRAPEKGMNGWALLLGDEGEISFRIGGKKDYTELIAQDVYSSGETIAVSCVYQNGNASISVNGKKVAEKSGIPHGTKDSTQAGTFGATLSGFEAVGEVMGESTRKPKGKSRNYVGSVSNLRIYNRVAD